MEQNFSPMPSAEKVLTRIRRERANFSAAQSLVASYVLDNYFNIPFMSITSLANNIGVSENSVIKFCNQIGYDKFTEFKKALSNCARDELVMSNRLSQNLSDDVSNSIMARSLQDDVSAIESTLLDSANMNAIDQLIPMIDSAQRLYITGGRSSAILAQLFVTMLRCLGVKVYYLDTSSSDAVDCINIVEKEDLVIAISMPRYTRHVIRSLQILHDAGVPIVVITDTGLSPALSLADLSLYCKVSSSNYFPSVAGCVGLIDAICRAVGLARKERAAQYISHFEQQLIDEDIFI